VPLPSGHFNLEQALWELGRIRSNLDLAAQIVRKQDAKEAKPALVGCAPEGRRIYVKQVPAHVPTSLGSLILPSIVELTGDGALRANKSETIEWLKFTLEGVGERTHGYAFEDTAF
jgi:hypothetical protein